MDQGKRVMRLKCSIQNYAWGRRGEQSAVGRLYALQSKAAIEPDKPYAELWMGTHESGPSFVVMDSHVNAGSDGANGAVNGVQEGIAETSHEGNGCTGGGFKFDTRMALDAEEDGALNDYCNGEACSEGFMPLKDWLSMNTSALGDKVLQRWGADLPFLFKVLSVEKALSIQAHPDKCLAERLHRLEPNIYKDANHKPEMAFAITSFEALCGFVSLQELQSVVEMVPELQNVLGKALSNALMNLSESSKKVVKSTLKAAFFSVMTASKDVISTTLTQLLSRLERVQQERLLTSKELLILQLAEQYPGDVGILSALFLNYIHLDPGEALYLDANEPHAYLAGECLECMATSDNVVRAGLTPKYIDTKTLCDMLTYKQGMPEILSGKQVSRYTKRYIPPFDEFEMDSCMLSTGQTEECQGNAGLSIVIVLQGSGDMSEFHNGMSRSQSTVVQSGDVLFIPAGTRIDVTASSRVLQFYRAGVNSRSLSEANGHV